MLRRKEGAAIAAWLGAAAFLAGTAPGQSQDPSGKEEVFEKVDPHTRGERGALERAGYVSFGPFEWAEGLRTDDVEETLGAGGVLWVETAHFKIGSTLASYPLHNDTKEEKVLDAELARLKPKLAWYQPPRNRIDPWLRLHLYAQRLEEIHARFAAELGFAGQDAGAKKPAAPSQETEPAPGGPEPPAKFRILLAEKTSALGRFLKRYADREPRTFDRFPLPGGSLFLGVTAEGVRTDGYALDIGLHCVVAGEITHLLIDGFCGTAYTCPLWLEYGLAHVVSRRVDERFTPSVGALARGGDEDAAKWEKRVKGLVQNGMAPPWTEMLAWERWEDIKTAGHLAAWSRVSWLLKRKPAELHAFLLGAVRPQPGRTPEDGSRIPKAQQEEAARAAFGKSIEELDLQWKKFAAR